VISAGEASINAKMMKSLHDVLPAGEELEIEGEWRSLRIGRLTIGQTLPAEGERHVATARAGDAAILQDTAGKGSIERAAAGVTEAHDEMAHRLDAAIKQAMLYLGPFGVQEVELCRFVLADASRRKSWRL
jgi:hypothetical protein